MVNLTIDGRAVTVEEGTSILDAAERIGDFEMAEIGLTEEEAHQEASRCLRCDHFGFGAFRGGRNFQW